MDFTADCAAITCPTLVTTGEPHLDAVVPVEATRRYLSLIPGAKYAMIERTGHLGPAHQTGHICLDRRRIRRESSGREA